jgi:hypothetical protein
MFPEFLSGAYGPARAMCVACMQRHPWVNSRGMRKMEIELLGNEYVLVR